ncbi:MAG: rRNA pseudouridine synthase [Lachnospiraceae bacterium]|jgi:23S rRNA pseudouridine2604 synthase|nr:rRNA pseudouridine synthase [Lachnospiraceae bacterium]
MRLNKYIAEMGLCSRREADRLIAGGRVTVNGRAAGLGDQVGETDEVAVNGKALRQKLPERVVLAYYKPVGVTCTARDRHAEKTVADALGYPTRLTYAGRLDRAAEGLLLMTNDGDLIEALMRGSHGHEKEYLVKVNKKITDDMIERLQAGVFLPDLGATTRPCQAEAVGERTLRLILTQGLNRQIRRMCEACGLRAVRIKRLRVANVRLGQLKPGEYREVRGAELAELYKMCGRGDVDIAPYDRHSET